MYKVETAGDCYIVAGGLMQKDEDGFLSIDNEMDAGKGAEKVMAFAKVGRAGGQLFLPVEPPHYLLGSQCCQVGP